MRDICDVYAHGLCVIWSSPRSAERTERTERHPHVVQTHTHTTNHQHIYAAVATKCTRHSHLASSSCSAQRNDDGDDAQRRRRSHNNEVECVHLMDCHIRGVNSHARCVRCTHLHAHTQTHVSQSQLSVMLYMHHTYRTDNRPPPPPHPVIVPTSDNNCWRPSPRRCDITNTHPHKMCASGFAPETCKDKHAHITKRLHYTIYPMQVQFFQLQLRLEYNN